jgi:hypothetical protein
MLSYYSSEAAHKEDKANSKADDGVEDAACTVAERFKREPEDA